ncbi:hypothetical protein ISS07_06765 [Candidatus Woesearchaeota archaeon]|nr:hypothetical protein [Candidatus Woesearchaeota archaeon]
MALTSRTPGYRHALANEDSRPDFAKNFEKNKPDFVTSVDYATDEILEKLKNKLGYVPPDGAWAKSLPLELNLTGAGSRTRIFLLPQAFSEKYKMAPKNRKEDIGMAVSNVISSHEFSHAEHYFEGFEDYPHNRFIDNDGNLNQRVFGAADELLAHKAEYDGLKSQKKKSRTSFFDLYLSSISQQASRYYSWLFEEKFVSGLDPKFVDSLRENLDPKLLFR